ncbi:unnamed protein product [Symbiodinium natans]|uniref:Endonuclease/exonuclease/phosphatase domain-containing protein n=1 Tax=Symbiodinium natans TaxID=878477 RepID=A0A812TR86_9DINO|nr:unnamed protein product [Symbiodinium natans]
MLVQLPGPVCPEEDQPLHPAMSFLSIGCAVQKALMKKGLLPAELTAALGVPPDCGAVAPAEVPEPSPYGMARYVRDRWKNDVPKCRWISSFLQQALAAAEKYELRVWEGGWVAVISIIRRFPQLHEATFGTPHALVRMLGKDPTRALETKLRHNQIVVRRVEASERLQTFVESYASRLPPLSCLEVSELLQNPHVKRLFQGSELPHRPLLECLRPCCLFDVDPRATALTLRPLSERLRLGLEDLCRCPEGHLYRKLLRGEGTVALSYMLRRFGLRLLGDGNLRLSPQQAWEALGPSTELDLDPKAVTLTLRDWQSKSAQPALMPIPSSRAKLNYLTHTKPGKGYRRTYQWQPWLLWRNVRKLREVLEFYTEPFSVQNNRLFLQGGEGCGLWPLQPLVLKLARLANYVGGMNPSELSFMLGLLCQEGAKNFEIISALDTEQPLLKLRYHPDFRHPLVANNAPDWVAEMFATAEEELPSTPSGCTTLLSCNLRCEESLDTRLFDLMGKEAERAPRLARRRWQNRLLRQFVTYEPDILCLQQVEADITAPLTGAEFLETGDAAAHELAPQGRARLSEATLLAAIVHRLESEDYEWCAAPVGDASGCANVVFWKRCKWSAMCWGQGTGGAICISLAEVQEEQALLPTVVVNMSGASEEDFAATLQSLRGTAPLSGAAAEDSGATPSIICASAGFDLANQAPTIFEEQGLGHMRSAHLEVLGEELPWTEIVAPNTAEEHLRCSDGVWVAGRALGALSGHKFGPRRQGERVCRTTFPCDHLASVVVLETGSAEQVADRLANLTLQ